MLLVMTLVGMVHQMTTYGHMMTTLDLIVTIGILVISILIITPHKIRMDVNGIPITIDFNTIELYTPQPSNNLTFGGFCVRFNHIQKEVL